MKLTPAKIKRVQNRLKGVKRVPLPNESPDKIPENAACAICSEDRIVERAHIFPKRFIADVKGIDRGLLDYNGRNVVFLCPTHHRLFDHFRLNPQEMTVIWGKVEKILKEFAFDVIGKIQCASTPEAGSKRNWDMVAYIRRFADYIEKHYGNY